MATLRSLPMRHLSCRYPLQVSAPQRRWARVHDVRFVATQHAQERITDRYREKLQQKAREKGLNDIGQLKEVYKDEITNLKKKAAVPGATAPLSSPQPQSYSDPTAQQSRQNPPKQPLDQISPSSPNYTPPGVKTLSSFLDIPKVIDLPQRELEGLWRLRHMKNPQSLCATLQSDIYANVARNARRHPQFILPGLPQTEAAMDPTSDKPTAAEKGGATIHFLQWTFPSPETVTVLFTHLAEYKLRGEHSQPHTTLTYHLELADSKGMVFCQGNVMPDRGVSVEEGKWLVMQLQRFYHIGEDLEKGETNPVSADLKRRRRRLVEMFTSGDTAFKVEDLLDEAERLG